MASTTLMLQLRTRRVWLVKPVAYLVYLLSGGDADRAMRAARAVIRMEYSAGGKWHPIKGD